MRSFDRLVRAAGSILIISGTASLPNPIAEQTVRHVLCSHPSAWLRGAAHSNPRRATPTFRTTSWVRRMDARRCTSFVRSVPGASVRPNQNMWSDEELAECVAAEVAYFRAHGVHVTATSWILTAHPDALDGNSAGHRARGFVPAAGFRAWAAARAQSTNRVAARAVAPQTCSPVSFSMPARLSHAAPSEHPWRSLERDVQRDVRLDCR